MIKILIAISLIAIVAHASTLGDWWRGFCEWHLVADDPYQYERLSVDQLVRAFHQSRRAGGDTKGLAREIRARLARGGLRPDDREILTEILVLEGGDH